MERYSRKDFFRELLNRSLKMSRTVFSDAAPAAASNDDPAAETDEWFNAAMAAGIDPASVPAGKLKAIVTRVRNEKK